MPVEALREIDTDEYARVRHGKRRTRAFAAVVTVGLIDYTTAEITSGLEAGEVVTTGVVETGPVEFFRSERIVKRAQIA